MAWIDCVVDHDYEIYSDYPHQIRKKVNKRIVSESLRQNGYVQLCMNLRNYTKHRVIALQFIPNPNNLPSVDHINHNKVDNRVENLRWVSNSDNNKNKSSHRQHVYQYLDEIPADSVPLDFYNDHEFEGYSIDSNDNVYYHNGIRFRKLYKADPRGTGNYSVNMHDINGHRVTVYLNKWHNQ